jgi:exopolysaccharide/PEP-CTERM locus tyrosine autokinase
MGKFSKALEKTGVSLFKTEKTGPAEADITGREMPSPISGTSVEKGRLFWKKKNQNIGTAGWDERLTAATGFSNATTEAFRLLRSKILMPADGRVPPKTIMVTSALPQEGKSFAAANLAIALAHGVDQYSLLVDCDLRMPSLATKLGMENQAGLVDYLRGDAEIPDLIQKTALDKLSILTSGQPPVNPAELLSSTRMNDLVYELSSRYPDRFVVFDTPPMTVASESLVLSKVVDAVIVVVRHGMAGRTILQRIVGEIGKEKILGVIFNGHKTNIVTSYLLYEIGRAHV